MPVKQVYIHGLIPKEKRATVISFDSMVGNVGEYLSKVISISFGYIVGSFPLFIVIPFIMKLKNRGDEEDRLNS